MESEACDIIAIFSFYAFTALYLCTQSKWLRLQTSKHSVSDTQYTADNSGNKLEGIGEIQAE